VFGSFGVFFVFCYLRPESSAARFFMNGPRYPRAFGRNGFIILAGICFLGCVAGLANR
jgi:hypothetical protein